MNALILLALLSLATPTMTVAPASLVEAWDRDSNREHQSSGIFKQPGADRNEQPKNSYDEQRETTANTTTTPTATDRWRRRRGSKPRETP